MNKVLQIQFKFDYIKKGFTIKFLNYIYINKDKKYLPKTNNSILSDKFRPKSTNRYVRTQNVCIRGERYRGEFDLYRERE